MGFFAQELVENLSGFKQLMLPPYLLQLRLKLLLEQQKSTSNMSDSEDTNDCSSDCGSKSVYGLFTSHTSALGQQAQQREQRQPRNQVPVFLVSARTGSGIKQLWQHVLKTAAMGPLRPTPKAAAAPEAAAEPAGEDPVSANKRTHKSRKMALLLAGPSEMPDDCF